MTAETPNTLEGIPLFRSLSPEARDTLLRRSRWRRFAAQEQIIERDDPGRDVFFVAEGSARVVNYSLSGREVSFDDMGAGSFFGQLSALDDQPRSANVVAVVDTLVLAVPQQVFLQVATENPKIALAVMRNLAAVLRQATERIMDLSTLGANNRVHAEILRLARPNLKPDGTAVITPIPLHGDIASRVSTTRETVARVFGDLARSGLVERREHQLKINDFQTLVDMVEEVRGEI
ncbi:MAG TPA: Crp/Fnr family transcriptional regulator [Alphaproteobacteria bacterium]|nr:Crp/Fnr family transcriptional regulator [Alphaproteobacteria bacterium]